MNVMKKVLLTATVQSHICQFHKPLVRMLHENGYEVHAAARNNLAEKNGLSIDFVDKVFDVPFSRSPRSRDNIKAYKELKKIIAQGDYDYIHCNTPMGGIVTRLAARSARKKGAKVLYTAHGFHFFKGSSLKNWLLFYPVEKLMAHECDILIAITEEDYQLAKKKFKTNAAHIHGVGVDPDRYHPVPSEEALAMRQREGLKDTDYVILCVGELNDNKNQKTLIAAAEMIKDQIPELKILLAGNGPREQELRTQIEKAGLTDQILMLGYRTDLERITPAVDLVVSCSFREGLPLNIVEAEFCKKPVVVSVNRGHDELVADGVKGFKVRADQPAEFAEKIMKIFSDPALAKTMGENGYIMAQNYTYESVEKELYAIYEPDHQDGNQ